MMNHILRPLPFVLASTNTGTMIINHCDRHSHPIKNHKKSKNISGGGGNKTQNDNATQNIDSSDEAQASFGVGFQYLASASFDAEEVMSSISLLHLRKQYFGDGVVAIDGGANIGAHTISWGIEMTYFGEVLAFEPQERIYYALCGNIAINNCFNVRALHAALGNPQTTTSTQNTQNATQNTAQNTTQNATIEVPLLNYATNSSFGSLELRQRDNNEFIGQHIDYTRTQKVPLISIDSLGLSRIDYIKIDCEGMELEVLNGALQSIKHAKPILQIEIIKSNPQEIIDLLKPFGYEIFPFGINFLVIHKDDPCLKHINQNNVT